MGLSHLEIENFRNLNSVQITPDSGLNLIVGDNAAGKSNLLEAIYYLGFGRSFRRLQIKHLLSHESKFFRLVCQLDDNTTHIGLERNTQTQKIRVNSESISRISELASLLPVLIIHPDSHHLISSGPENRRQFMDWGVFHVEHYFISAWKQYKKALSQRNASLRLQQSQTQCALWDKGLVEYALSIEKFRLNYLNQLSPIINELSQTLFPGNEIKLIYKRGWPAEMEFKNYLTDHIQKDRERGFTQSGPHRADITILIDDMPAQITISRGQQKKLVTLLKISQLILFSRLTHRRCILLYDDLSAELDKSNQTKIMHILSGLDIQLFVSAINVDQINCNDWSHHSVFHVEHGVVSEVELINSM